MEFTLSTQPDSSGVTLVIAGEVDIATAQELRDGVLRALDEYRPVELRLDMSGVTFCDSSGLGALVAARNAATDRTVALRLVEPSRAVRRVLTVTSLDDLFLVDPADQDTAAGARDTSA